MSTTIGESARMKFPISAIDANPFRNIERYPIREDKIAALRESLRSTGFWDNVVARLVDGRPQIAYGHHRREALLREYPPDHEVTLIIRDLSDEMMIKIMAKENMEEWGSSAQVEHETIRAVVEAYASGRIELEPPSPKVQQTRLRFAPSFVQGHVPATSQEHRPYTAQSLADFLGWTEPSGDPQRKVGTALAALEFIEDGTLSEADFAGMSTYQAAAVVEQARKAKAAAELRAKEERARAERAAKEAAEAEKRRAEAEAERERRQREAAAAREEAARRRAQAEAEAARRRAEQAERAREEAARREEIARKREQARREEGRQEAATVGRHVGRAMRNGQGYAKAANIADEVRARPAEPPKNIETHADKLASDLNKLLDAAASDPYARKLDELLRFQSNMSAGALRGLLIALDQLSDRVDAYRRKLINPSTSTPRHTVVDGETVQPVRLAIAGSDV